MRKTVLLNKKSKVKAQSGHRVFLILVWLLFIFAKPVVAQQQNQGSSLSGTEQGKVGPIRITVTDPYGRYVSGLNQDQITILDEKMPQEILGFEQGDEPFSLLLLFDVSKSMPANGLTAAREEFLRFVETGNKSSNYAIVGFGKEASMLTEFTKEKDSVVDGLNKLATLKRSRSTAFYDAFSLAVEKIQAQKNKNRIILIISDGEDNDSESRKNDLREKLKKTDVLVYAIVFSGPEPFGPGQLPFAEPDLTSSLSSLCSMTGGKAFYPRASGGIGVLFEALALELKSQYSVTFRPSGLVKDGEWRRLKYKVRPFEFKKKPTSGVKKVTLYIRGPEGYYLR